MQGRSYEGLLDFVRFFFTGGYQQRVIFNENQPWQNYELLT